MKLTNNQNLPQALVNACNLNRHNKKNCFSATTLNKGIKEIILENRHFDDIEMDASDNIWAIFGTAVHSIFEKQNDNTFKEEKFSVQVGSSTVTGQVDCYDLENEIIFDWKTASVWKVQFKDFSDWKSQGLTYAWLLSKKGLKVKKCVFVALLKDHSKSKARFDSQYPQSPVYTFEFEVTKELLESQEKWIKAKIEQLEKADLLLDDLIEPCTKEERWADDDKWAVMKEGRKTAVRVFDDEDSAKTLAYQLGKGHYIEKRNAISRKCEDYCRVCQWCNFYKENHKEKEIEK